MFYEKFEEDEEYYKLPDIKHVQKKFVVKNDNGVWKIDEFSSPR